MDNKSKASQVLSELMLKGLSKDPHLAAKQRRLLEKLSNDTNSPTQSDAAGSESNAEPPPPAGTRGS